MRFDQELFEYALSAAREFENGLDSRRVVPAERDIDNIDAFDEPLPANGTAALDVIKTLHEVGSPATTLTRSGRFFGFVVGGAHPVSIAANWIASTWDQNAALPVLGHTAAKLEEVSASWILEMLNLPRDSGMGFVSGSTMAGFTALCAARYKLCKNKGYDLKKRGILRAPRIRIVLSEDIHPTNIVALQYMGYGLDDLEFVAVDDQGRMRLDQMPELDDQTIVIAQAGNINSGAFDPFRDICTLAKRAGAWVHIDSAFGGWLRLSEKRGHLTQGMELADSWSLDCHKWLNVPYDSAVAICRDADAMREFFGVSASYLINGEARVPSHFTPELSRRARGIDIWATIKCLGRKGIAGVIDRCCDQALYFSKQLEKLGFTVMNDVCINQVVFGLLDDKGQYDEAGLKAIMTRVQESGTTWFGPTKWGGQNVYRMSICSAETTDDDLTIALRAIRSAMEISAPSSVRRMKPARCEPRMLAA
jgi:glutamate/tyrosine decarboxylase-like PLP-dependent enzyme